ncbi:MAG: extracellular solute-binding protein [Solirubrobacteraceae bacterium]
MKPRELIEQRPEAGRISRRELVRSGAVGAAALTIPGLLSGCGGQTRRIPRTGGDPWKQFAGTTLNFISENTPPTSAIAANTKPFEQLTGIKVNIVQLELSAMVERVALDFASGQGAYQVIYADPYQVIAPYHKALTDLNEFNTDRRLPHVQNLGDFIPIQLEAAGKFQDPSKLYALPYDAPTMIWMYRKDLFAKYGSQMRRDLGFDPTPSEQTTWTQYLEMARWFNQHATSDVAYGTGHMAKEHDSLMNDFSNVLWAWGGDYFQRGDAVGRLGLENPGPISLTSSKASQAASFYRDLLKAAHPGSTGWDWTALSEAFGAGQVAMAPLWHEFTGDLEKGKLKGKIGFSLLPRGPVRSANMYGGTGLGVNGSAPKDQQRAAWLFVVWATSKETQLANLKSKAGGGTPTRRSVYDIPEVVKARRPPSAMPNILTYEAVTRAWQPHNIGLRPKIPAWNECDSVIFSELSTMLAGGDTPSACLSNIASGMKQAVKTAQALQSA